MSDGIGKLAADAAEALLLAARKGGDSRRMREALRALIAAYIESARFNPVLEAIRKAHLGKRATTSLDEIAAISAGASALGRQRASVLTQILVSRHARAGDPAQPE